MPDHPRQIRIVDVFTEKPPGIKTEETFLAVGQSSAVVVEVSIGRWDGIFLLPNVAHPIIVDIDPGN